jgi:hypothetical protein
MVFLPFMVKGDTIVVYILTTQSSRASLSSTTIRLDHEGNDRGLAASAWSAVLLAAAAAASDDDAAGGAVVSPSRMGKGCAGTEDIAVYQGNATSLPSGAACRRTGWT